MASGRTVSDGRTWDIKLRDGLKFDDGEPLLFRDAAAILKRRVARIVDGQVLGAIWKACRAQFPRGTVDGQEFAAQAMNGDINAATKALQQAGYAGEHVVTPNPADVPTIAPFGQVTYDVLKTMGMNVGIQEMDLITLAQRRTKNDPPHMGGWSIFRNRWLGPWFINPAIGPVLRGLATKGWGATTATRR